MPNLPVTPRHPGHREQEGGFRQLQQCQLGIVNDLQHSWITLAFVAVSAILPMLSVVTVVFSITVTAARNWLVAAGTGKAVSGFRRLTVGPGYVSGRADHGHRGHNHGHGRGGRPCEEEANNRECCGGVKEIAHGVVSVGKLDLGHDPSQSATKQMAASEPTNYPVSERSHEAERVMLLASIFNMSSRPIRLLCISW